ncbi:hypothetical protein AALP_AA7G124800 [Arabis alpina]|uniref:Uncharacterized protein n=1 Tax=Arabis alpina TaxID=50452 RepID=A0A087GHL4_ARAAL|nr:hypothetical protein AALP_AA7G124800 [Arabis alpina]
MRRRGLVSGESSPKENNARGRALSSPPIRWLVTGSKLVFTTAAESSS